MLTVEPVKSLRKGTYELKGLVLDEEDLLDDLNEYLCNNDLPEMLSLNEIGGPFVAIQHGKYQGRVNRRLKKKLLETECVDKLPKGFAVDVGDIVSKLVIRNHIILEITDNLDWKDGDYGDDDSCFWDSRKVVRTDIFPKWGVHAALIRNKKTDEGMARWWLYPLHEKDQIIPKPSNPLDLTNVYVGFNPYGYDMERMQRIMKYQFNWESREIEFEGDGAMFVNNGESVIFNAPKIAKVFTSMGSEANKCDNCDNYFMGSGDYCGDCITYAECFGCGEGFDENEMRNKGGELFCYVCSKKWTVCEDCDGLYKVKDGCDSCKELA